MFSVSNTFKLQKISEYFTLCDPRCKGYLKTVSLTLTDTIAMFPSPFLKIIYLCKIRPHHNLRFLYDPTYNYRILWNYPLRYQFLWTDFIYIRVFQIYFCVNTRTHSVSYDLTICRAKIKSTQIKWLARTVISYFLTL